MTILALEFSSPQRSVAVLRTDGAAMTAESIETGGHGANAFGMIEQVLAEAKIEREQIDALAVGLGPGSYTGIRAAISLAQGWQLARGVKLLGVSSAETIAAQARAEKIPGRVNVVIDAQRNEFYLATYEITPDGWREIAPLKILSRAEVESRAAGGEILAGPEVTKWFPNGRLIFPRAVALAELVARRGDFTPGEKLEPIYLRETNFVKAAPRLPGAS
ncbi:MAG: tRNA (adenosine(37)-N6)-threonylcarbamoyltransferase complex dimerization subunit type 1 TsaB [Verrucomicrobiota bacterium]|jgi:tRNA threonylcarbamoyladenosine biosynthesis protein TsaB